MKTKKRFLSILLSLVMVLGLLPGMSLTALAAPEPVAYMAWNGTAVAPVEGGCTDYTVVDANTTTFEDGKWYVVNEDVTIASRITVSGTAHLILCDGKKLNANRGISVTSGKTLNIYGQSDDNMGELTASAPEYYAVIGGIDSDYGDPNCGSVIINGGTVNAIGSTNSCTGIGGGYAGFGGSVTINGGTVTAIGGGAVGIGKGEGGATNNGTLTLGPGVAMEVSNDNSNWSVYDDNTRTLYMRANSHTHSFTYNASGAVITATCTNTDKNCPLPPSTEGGTDHVAALTIVKPTLETYGQTGEGISAEATITDTNSIKGDATVSYYKANDAGTAKTGNVLSGAPTDAGKYWAEITLGTGTNTATAHVVYDIAPVSISSVAVTDITAPEAAVALDTAAATSTANVTLSNSGSITWDPAAPQDGNAAYATAYKATVTATADENYAFADNATATVNGQTATVTKNTDGTLAIAYTFDKTALEPVTITATNKEVTYSAEGIAIPVEGMFTIPQEAGEATYSVEVGQSDTGEGSYAEGKLTVTKCGTFTVKVSTAATDTHAAGDETTATLTVNKAAPTVTPPTAKTLTYTGSAQELINAGSTADGTMKYAVTTKNEAPADDNLYTTSIPTGTNAGT